MTFLIWARLGLKSFFQALVSYLEKHPKYRHNVQSDKFDPDFRLVQLWLLEPLGEKTSGFKISFSLSVFLCNSSFQTNKQINGEEIFTCGSHTGAE